MTRCLVFVLCVLLGPSGCGKSTLLRVIAGLETPSEGRVLIKGRDVTDVPPGDRDVAMVFQSYAIYPHMTAFENIAFPHKVRKTPKAEIRDRVYRVARLLHLEDLLERRPHQLSGGERQRVAMGRAIVRNPTVFLFDEPLSNLDAKLRIAMRMEIAQLHRSLGFAIIYVTHDQVEAMTLADRIAVLDRGAIQQIDTPQGLYHHPANVMVAQFIGMPAMNLIPGRLERAAGRAMFRSNSMNVEVLEARHYGEVYLGVRPEHIDVRSPGTCSGRVDFIEDTGTDLYALVTIEGNERLVVRLPPGVRVRTGETISLMLDPTRVHVFPRDES
ncbi:MAG: ABC transporter ATP-binding protein [Thermodesulfobacteriota bacterium]